MHNSSRRASWRRPHNAPKPSRQRRPAKKQSQIPSHHFVNKAIEPTKEAPYKATHAFSDFALSDQLKRNLQRIGFETPSPIQDQAIIPGLQGRDVLGLANTGTGKTAAFLLPIIEKLTADRRPISALILAPTRELAQQIDRDFQRVSGGMQLYSAVIVGGININRQIKSIQRGPHIVIGTPGRVNDLIDRRTLRLHTVTTFVLDEADRMCDMGFVRDIKKIEAELPRQRQTLCFSATMDTSVSEIVRDFMHDPVTISVVKNQTNDHIEQDIIHAHDKAHKIEILKTLLPRPEFEKVIVFNETKFGAQRLADNLTKNNIPAVAIHGNKSQSQRERALRSFATGEINVMVATDVAARGLDIPNVSHVINFDPPKIYDDYVHRIGRTGRAGKTGQAITFVNDPSVPPKF